MQSRGKGFGKAECYSRCSQRSATLLWKRRKWRREYPRQLCRPQDLVNALLELLAFNISIQAPYFSGIRRRQTSVEWRMWPGVWERQMGWRGTSQSRQLSPEVSSLLLAPSMAQVGFPRSSQLDLVPAHPRDTRQEGVLMQDLQHSCSHHSHCLSRTCWFGNSCSQVILGLIAWGFPPCTY